VLQNTLAELYNEKINDDYYRPVRTYVLNPKSVTLGELYGEMNPFTLEWKDGLLGILMRTAVQVSINYVFEFHVIVVWIL
jgi:dynein heavy chain